MRTTTRLLGAALLLAGAALAGPSQAGAPPKAPAGRDIDLVICLDVSNSMDGLIDSAKARLWDIVNYTAKGTPTPNLRVALYSYGRRTYDRKVGWVQKELDLTTDLDALYQKLFALTTNGGIEYVTRVSVAAVEQLQWSPQKDALKVIFVCGNEPATQDPTITLKAAADRAKARGVIINPIYCGNPNDADARSWKELAQVSGGRFASIDQNRGAMVKATPMDGELADLGRQLNGTYVCYGKAGKDKALNQVAQTVNAGKAGAGVAAARTVAQNSALYRCEDWDLVDRCKADPKFDVGKVPAEELSEEMRKLAPAERVARVKEMAARRAKLQQQITELTARRVAYLQEEAKRNPDPAGRAFDAAVRETLRVQAAPRGIALPRE
jgi:hypothetical protein